jgi:hypothetical protein
VAFFWQTNIAGVGGKNCCAGVNGKWLLVPCYDYCPKTIPDPNDICGVQTGGNSVNICDTGIVIPGTNVTYVLCSTFTFGAKVGCCYWGMWKRGSCGCTCAPHQPTCICGVIAICKDANGKRSMTFSIINVPLFPQPCIINGGVAFTTGWSWSRGAYDDLEVDCLGPNVLKLDPGLGAQCCDNVPNSIIMSPV